MNGRRIFWFTLVLASLVAMPAAAADPKYLPSETELIVTVNVKQILDSALVKKQKNGVDQAKALLEAKLQEKPEVRDYLKAVGFDLFRDLISISVGLPPGKDPENGFVILEGQFNPGKFETASEDAVRQHPNVFSVSTVGKQKIFEAKSPDGKQIFLNLAHGKNLLISSNRETLVQAIARGEGSSSRGGLTGTVKRLAEATNNTQSFSFVATGNLLAKAMNQQRVPNAEALMPILQSIDGISGAVTINQDVQIQLGVGTSDAETAQKLSFGAQGGLLFLRNIIDAQAKKDDKFAPLVEVAKTMRIITQGSNIVFRAELSMEVIDKLMNNFKKN